MVWSPVCQCALEKMGSSWPLRARSVIADADTNIGLESAPSVESIAICAGSPLLPSAVQAMPTNLPSGVETWQATHLLDGDTCAGLMMSCTVSSPMVKPRSAVSPVALFSDRELIGPGGATGAVVV